MDILTLVPQGKLGWLAVVLGTFGKVGNKNDQVQSHTGKRASMQNPPEQDGHHLRSHHAAG